MHKLTNQLLRWSAANHTTATGAVRAPRILAREAREISYPADTGSPGQRDDRTRVVGARGRRHSNGRCTCLCGEPVHVFRVGQPTEEKHHGLHGIAGVPLVALRGKQVRSRAPVGGEKGGGFFLPLTTRLAVPRLRRHTQHLESTT